MTGPSISNPAPSFPYKAKPGQPAGTPTPPENNTNPSQVQQQFIGLNAQGLSPTGHPSVLPSLDPSQHPQASFGAINSQIGDGRSDFPPAGGELGRIGWAHGDPTKQSVGMQQSLDPFQPGFPLAVNPQMLNAPGMMPLQMPDSISAQLTTPPGPQSVQISAQGATQEAAQLLMKEMEQKETQDQEKKKKALKAIYGDAFPLCLDHEATDADWQRWCDERWALHRPGVQHNIWMAERNRQFRAGYQYQSRINSMGAWRETPIPRDAVRIIDNRIRPALAWAMQVVAEQRPGWQFKPTNTDADRERKAEAQQRAVEYQYDAQKKRLIDKESIYWAQTDGVSFQMTYWDPNGGPWEESSEWIGKKPLGDVCTRVVRLEQVVVSSEATANVKPMYWFVRDVLPMQYAVSLYGPEVADAPDQALLAQQVSQWSITNQYAYAPLYQNQTTVNRYFVFCDQRDWLPGGLTAIVVGRKLVYGPNPLLIGRPPMLRITDGSEDPAFFPVPKMNLLIAPQMRINMLWSKWYESIRKNSGGRYASKTNAVSAETFIGGETSILEVRTSGDIRESFMPVQAFSVGNDIKEALDREISTIEELTGYTKEARGQFENDESGRAILAQRETLERVFAPQSAALSEGNTEWAKQMVGWMKFGWQMPRKISVLGKNRSDLATQLTAADMDGEVDVTVDPATMIPKPVSLKRWELDNAYDRKIIGAEEWRERSQFGDTRDFQTPNDVQYARAKRIAEQILLRQPVEGVLWQENEAIVQNVLERDIILAGGIEQDVMEVALQRWQASAQQQAQKMGAMPGAAPPGPPAGVPQQSGAPGKGQPMDPRIAPLAAGNPSVAAGPAALQGGPGVSNREQAVARFERANMQ